MYLGWRAAMIVISVFSCPILGECCRSSRRSETHHCYCHAKTNALNKTNETNYEAKLCEWNTSSEMCINREFQKSYDLCTYAYAPRRPLLRFLRDLFVNAGFNRSINIEYFSWSLRVRCLSHKSRASWLRPKMHLRLDWWRSIVVCGVILNPAESNKQPFSPF